jgi:histidinol-phosphate aminotransferase
MLHAPDYVRAIAPYQGGKPVSELAREYGLDESRIVKLASNENPLGMPQSARDAMAAAAVELARYPDGNGFALKSAISKRFDVPLDWITLGNGSNDILELATRAFVQPGESTVFSAHAFAVYALASQAVGARSIVVPTVASGPQTYGHDLDAMLQAITTDTRIVFVANPNNPTGTFLPAAAVERFLKQVPTRVLVVYDEAYTEYLRPEERPDAFAWVRRFPNLLVSRSFSKAYGLAGLRVGYGVAQPLVTDLLNRLRQPFNVNLLAQAAAVAALSDGPWLEQAYRANREGMAQLESGLDAIGVRWLPSWGNFLLVQVVSPSGSGASEGVNQSASAGDPAMPVYERLLRAGVIVRPVGNYALNGWLRVSVGLPEENATFLAALPAALPAALSGAIGR